jgi:hypothetical protein
MSDLYGSLSIQILKGSSRTLRLQVLDQEGNAVNLSAPAATVYFTVRKREGDADPAIISKVSSTPSQITILTPQVDADKKGKADIFLVPADTANLTPDQYRYDVWVVQGVTAHYVVIPPSGFEVRPSVTVIP